MRALLAVALMLGATFSAISTEATSVETVNLLKGVGQIDVQISIGSFPTPSNEILENDSWLFGRSKTRLREFEALLLCEISAALSERSIEIEPEVGDRLLVEIWGHQEGDSQRLNVHLVELTLIQDSSVEPGVCYDNCDCSISESARALSYSTDEQLQQTLISQTLRLLKTRWLDGLSQKSSACDR